MLDDDKWYVGITKDVLSRYDNHCEGIGSRWTRLHKPIWLFFVSEPYPNRTIAMQKENEMTLFMARMGLDVRGGIYCDPDETVREKRKHREIILHHKLNETC
jgi:hypothetical protein